MKVSNRNGRLALLDTVWIRPSLLDRHGYLRGGATGWKEMTEAPANWDKIKPKPAVVDLIHSPKSAYVALTEVFAAPQGEGYNAGRWAVFVRLAGCPLACEFAPGVVCDTPYMQASMTVTPTELFAEVIPEVLPGLRNYDVGTLPMLVLTGGEPTASPSFNTLVRLGRGEGFYVAVETNGTRMRTGLHLAAWISVSPKEGVSQTSRAALHNRNPQTTVVDSKVRALLRERSYSSTPSIGGEYRYVVTADSPMPPYHPAPQHYVSPAVLSDGSGEEWKTGFPGFAPGAVDRCLEIIRHDSRWRISVQTHKILGVR
jgi:organic radical activating enzyme